MDFFDKFWEASNLPERPEQTKWQRDEHNEFGQAPRRALFASPRLGKSLPALASALESGADKILIICPLVAAPQWARLVRDCGAEPIELYDLPTKRGAEILRKLGPGIVVVNDDKLSWLVDELLKTWRPEFLIADESHRFSGISTKRGRVYRRLAWAAQGVRILTGTPVPNHYGSLWGQMVGLDVEDWFGSYERFAQRYLIRDSMFPSIVLGYQNESELYAKIRKLATIKRREDVFGPDTWQLVTRPVVLPVQAARAYRQLAKEWFLDAPVSLDASHTLARMTRLHQLTSGFLPDPDTGETVELHNAKRAAIIADLGEIVEQGEKTVVFHQFTAEGNAIYDDIRAAFPKVTVLKIDGSTETHVRDDVYEIVETLSEPVILVAQTQAAGIARSLAECTHVMFASHSFSFVEQEQARDRVYKPGERRVVYDYIVEDSIDEFIADTLQTKRNIHEAVRNADRRDIVFGPHVKKRKRALVS